MFVLFFNLYYSMFEGVWSQFDMNGIVSTTSIALRNIGKLLTSMFNNVSTPMEDFGLFVENGTWLHLTSFILALITSIGIVFAAGKVLKRIFGVFFVLGR